MTPGSAVSKLLVAALQRKRDTHSGYSLRAFARDLGVSPAFVTNMMNGKRLPPRHRLEKISRLLELDIHERATLVQAVRLDRFSVRTMARQQRSEPTSMHRRKLVTGRINLLSQWYHLAVLEGLTLSGELAELEHIKTRLGITDAQLASALQTLKAEGLTKENNRDHHHYIPTGRSRREVREFHDQMMAKARWELHNRTSDEDFHRRLITGFTFALSSEQIDELKSRIQDFLSELTEDASRGECDEVYQCNLQLFPLTKVLVKK